MIDEDEETAEMIRLLGDQCAKWGHVWRHVCDEETGLAIFCVVCSTYQDDEARQSIHDLNESILDRWRKESDRRE